jgi:4-hydroxybenzoate polyprenyltransferase
MKKDLDLTLKWYDIFFLLRPILWVPLWVFVFLGYMYGKRLELFSITFLLPLKFFSVLFSYTFLMSSTYIINQIVDKESDRINDKLFLIPYGIVSEKLGWILSVLLALASLAWGYFAGGVELLILYFISLIMGLLYSLPPVQTKARPFLDIFFNAFGYGCIAFSVGWAVAEHLNKSTFIISTGYFLLVAAVFINTTIPDIPGDKKSGKLTTGVFLGQRFSSILASIIFFISLVYGFLEMDILLLLPSILGLILSIISIWDTSEDLIITKLSYRIPAFLFVLLVAVKFPIFLMLNLIILILLRKYYKSRFGLDYPSILGR